MRIAAVRWDDVNFVGMSPSCMADVAAEGSGVDLVLSHNGLVDAIRQDKVQ